MAGLNLELTKEMIMKTSIYLIFAAALLSASLTGCDTVKQESAIEWLQRQPVLIDP